LAKREKRNFTLVEIVNGTPTVTGLYTGYQPRDAALKCASRGKTKIVLRESGTKKLHLFNGTREQVNKPERAPDWLPDKVWESNVEKVGIRQLKWNELGRNPNDLFEF